MASTVVALYDDFASANAAVRDLVDNGFSRNDISIVASDATGEYGRYVGERTEMDTSSTAEGASVGAGIGAVIGGLGGLLVGLGALAIPGIGPVVAAGPLAAALSALAGAGAGAVAGGVTGGLLGALVDLGVPRETAEYYTEGVRRGGHLVTVTAADDMTNRAVELLNRHNPVDVNARVEQWRQTGWSGFDPSAESYRPTEEARDYPRTTGAGMDRGMESSTDYPRTTGAGMDRGMESSTDYPRTTGAGMDRGMESSTDYPPTTGAGMDSGTEWPHTTGTTSSFNDFSYYDNNFRQHFDTSTIATDYTYDQFRPAYRYGYDLATDETYRGRDWDEIEMDARRRWDERNPGTWDRFKDSVRHAWEEIKDAVS